MSADLDERREHMHRVVQNLEGEYGPRRNERDDDPLGTLVEIILSQQNSWQSTRRVYADLRRRFPKWEEAADASTDEIEEAIRSGGLARMKAARIKSILTQVRADRGALELDFLSDISPEAGLAYLTAFGGVGPKTARCTLLFACDAPVFPMDGHIFRILRRLGLLDPRLADEPAHRAMEALVPEGKHYSAHVNLIRHGREICRPAEPKCERCCLVEYCPTGQERLASDDDADPRVSRR